MRRQVLIQRLAPNQGLEPVLYVASGNAFALFAQKQSRLIRIPTVIPAHFKPAPHRGHRLAPNG